MSEHWTDKADKTHVAFIHETWRESVAGDIGTALTFVALWSLGHFADSPALEWVGALLGFAFLAGKILRLFRGAVESRMTPDEARAWLDQKFPKGKT